MGLRLTKNISYPDITQMTIDNQDIDRNEIKALQAAWRSRAAAQGLVCFVCGAIPAIEDRDQFYDTGLCGACARELNFGQDPMKGIT
jgi:hypothetical protein